MKRLLVFVLLLGIGFLVLQQVLGDEVLVTANTTPEPVQKQQPDTSATTIVSSRGGLGVGVEGRGELTVPRTRLVPQPDGTSKRETVFELHARDSRPLREGLQQLDDVTVTLFDRGVASAVLTATQATLELGRDGNGNPAIGENKDIDLRNAVLSALPGTRLDGLRLELDRARVHVEDEELLIQTPAPDDPVLVTFAGARSGTLVGKGLQARLPRDRNGALQRIDVDVLADPVLTTAAAVLRAKGRLHYAEDTRTGTGEVSLIDDVELSLDQSGGVRVHGDHVLGWLLRSRVGGHAQGDWRLLRLSGSPATIAVGDLTVTTPQVAVLPGPTGEPYWVRASGGASTFALARNALHPDRPELRGSSPRAIRLHLAGAGLGTAHRAFGFPQWTIAPLAQLRTVTLEGASWLDDGDRHVEAARGLDVHQLDERGEGVIAVGRGAVRVEQRRTAEFPAFTATGSDGFVLRRGAARDHLDLGPPRDDVPDGAWRRHTYEVHQGDLVASGRGACALDRRDGRAIVTLRAPDREIVVRLAHDDVRLEQVRWLEAELVGEGIGALAAAGPPAKVTYVARGETSTATAPRLEQTSHASFVLLPADPERAELWADLPPADALPRLAREAAATPSRGHQVAATTAPRIDVTHLGHGRVFVDARSVGDVLAHTTAAIADPTGKATTTIAFDAERLRAMPFALPPAILAAHTAGMGQALLPPLALADPWLIGERVANAVVVDPEAGTFTGQAHRFVLSAGAESGLLLGDSRTLTPATVQLRSASRTVVARGAQVRVQRGQDALLEALRSFPGRSVFVLPEIELHEASGDGLFAHMVATCDGDIRLLSEEVWFGGPVEGHTLAADGSTPADGLGIVAQVLRMQLRGHRADPRQGYIKSITGKDASMTWTRCSAQCAEISLDADRHVLTARDPVAARVVLANGYEVAGRQVVVDWQTLACDVSEGRLGGKPLREATR
ncbi:MAG: hypothetical protein U1E73_02565 [Planctomycetota bacterium]